MSNESKAKYRALKRKLRFLIYEQECFQEELRRAQRKLLKISRDKSFLLDRLLQYERVEGSSSASESTASSDSEKESKKSSDAKKQKKKAKPIKVKAKKRKQRQLKSLLGGEKKPLPGNLNYSSSQQQLSNNSKLMDLMKVGSPNLQIPQSPLTSLGLPVQSGNSLFPGVSLPGFSPPTLNPQQQSSKLSSLLAAESSAMGALMRAGLAAAAAGEKAEKQSKKRHKKEADKLPSQFHPSMYPSPSAPSSSSSQPHIKPSTSAEKSSSPITTPTDINLMGLAKAPSTKTPHGSHRQRTGEEEEGEELVIDIPND
ncbi:uncharacterized protein [Asterias amurensis]|uniref:uncharacterized protein n=1 Tax=Asterias amurensis TaxID=7602 RepID=UPI003AB3F712